MLTILLFHLWQRTGSDHLLFSSVVEADRRFRDCARRRFQRRIQRATGLCRCHLYLRCSFSGLWLFWNRQTFSLWYRIACNLIFNQSRCSWRIFRRNCRPGFIDFPNLFIGQIFGRNIDSQYTAFEFCGYFSDIIYPLVHTNSTISVYACMCFREST